MSVKSINDYKTDVIVSCSDVYAMKAPLDYNLESEECLVTAYSSEETLCHPVEERANWQNKLDFLFSIMGNAVGLGSIWRFPYLVYRHGGNFLLIFILAMFTLGLPLFLLEIFVGQYSGLTQVKFIERCTPIMKGVGYSGTVITTFFLTYYGVIISWAIHYFISSFLKIPTVVWSSCLNIWNDLSTCLDPSFVQNGTCVITSSNLTNIELAVEQYWKKRVLNLSGGLEHLGYIQYELVVTLLIAWVIAYSIVWKGLHASGKVIWFTAIFPYIVLIALFIKSVMLDGAVDGLLYYVTPRWETLTSGQAWVDGGAQVIFSFAVGSGSVVSLGSYNKYKHNFYRDAWIVGIINPLTALFAGCITFSVLGYLAKIMDVDIGEVVTQGPGLTFVVYPQVLAMMKGPAYWSILFFFMLILLGINSHFGSLEALIMTIVDEWPEVFRNKWRRYLLNIGIPVVLYLVGLTMTTQGGMYIFQLIDSCAMSGYPVIIQLLAVVLIYYYGIGGKEIEKGFEQMIGKKLAIFWKVLWGYIIPAFMLALLVFYAVTYKHVAYGDYEYPNWGVGIGALMSIMVVVWIPAYALYYLYKTPGTLLERLKKGVTSDAIKRFIVKESNLSVQTKGEGTKDHQLYI